jgi:hypothetical protein
MTADPTLPLAVTHLLAVSAGQIVLMALFGAVLTAVMILTRKRVRASIDASPPSARERYAELNQNRQTLRDVEEVMLQLEQVAREVHGQLDTRFAKLEAVIRDADRRIATLERLAGETGAKHAVDITLDEVRPDEDGPAPARASGPHAAVYRLADAGMDYVRIAEETGKTTGEVELILALRRARPEHATPAIARPAK